MGGKMLGKGKPPGEMLETKNHGPEMVPRPGFRRMIWGRRDATRNSALNREKRARGCGSENLHQGDRKVQSGRG